MLNGKMVSFYLSHDYIYFIIRHHIMLYTENALKMNGENVILIYLYWEFCFEMHFCRTQEIHIQFDRVLLYDMKVLLYINQIWIQKFAK